MLELTPGVVVRRDPVHQGEPEKREDQAERGEPGQHEGGVGSTRRARINARSDLPGRNA